MRERVERLYSAALAGLSWADQVKGDGLFLDDPIDQKAFERQRQGVVKAWGLTWSKLSDAIGTIRDLRGLQDVAAVVHRTMAKQQAPYVPDKESTFLDETFQFLLGASGLFRRLAEHAFKAPEDDSEIVALVIKCNQIQFDFGYDPRDVKRLIRGIQWEAAVALESVDAKCDNVSESKIAHIEQDVAPVDGVDVIQQALKAVVDGGLAGVMRAAESAPSPQKVSEQMRSMLAADVERYWWTVDDWACQLSCSKKTIVGNKTKGIPPCDAWKDIMAWRESNKRSRFPGKL